MTELDKVLDTVMKAKEDCIDEKAPKHDKVEFINALRESKKQQIIEEIRVEYKKEIEEEIQKELESDRNREKLHEIKSLLWNGFFLAFFVGLAVNQVTEILSFLKELKSDQELFYTILLSGVFLGVCVLMYAYSFLKSALKIFDEWKKDGKKSNSLGEEK